MPGALTSTPKMSKKILFISHSASRTGAPIVLLHFLRWLKANTDIPFDVLVGDSGELLPEFQALAPTRVLMGGLDLTTRICRKAMGGRRFGKWQDASFQRQFRRHQYGLVYANTVCNLREMALLSDLGIPVICHIHELNQVLDFVVGREAFLNNHQCVQHFIAVSRAVQDYLLKDWSISESRISLVHGFIPDKDVDARSQAQVRAAIRAQLGLVDSEVLVGGCGTLDWRKGVDLFVQLARSVRGKPTGQKIRFLWVGGKKGSTDFIKFEHDVKICGLSDAVTVIENCSNPLDYFSAMDVFALTSREDPFPLVMLEAASLRLPIVCFDGAGGGPEFIEEEAGLAAPYLDVDSFAAHVLALADNSQMRRSIGFAAAQKVKSRYTVEHQAPKILEIIHRHLGKAGPSFTHKGGQESEIKEGRVDARYRTAKMFGRVNWLALR
jgi:glycosyltransferase involved in cell wall biosynthesis